MTKKMNRISVCPRLSDNDSTHLAFDRTKSVEGDRQPDPVEASTRNLGKVFLSDECLVVILHLLEPAVGRVGRHGLRQSVLVAVQVLQGVSNLTFAGVLRAQRSPCLCPCTSRTGGAR